MVGVRPKISPVPQRLKEARERAGLSQRELGIRAGMDPGSASARVNQYERGRHAPDFGTLASIAHVLDLPVAYFYAVDDGLATWIVQYKSDLDA